MNRPLSMSFFGSSCETPRIIVSLLQDQSRVPLTWRYGGLPGILQHARYELFWLVGACLRETRGIWVRAIFSLRRITSDIFRREQMFFMDLRHFSFRKLVILWNKPSPQQSLFLLKGEIRIVPILKVEVIPCGSMLAPMRNVGGASYAPNTWSCRDCDCTNLNLNACDQAAILLPLTSALCVSAPLDLALTPCASAVYSES
jgi:hypothetical protein